MTDWKQYLYPYFPYAAESLAVAGCGPTACADLLDVEPTETATWLTDHGYAYPYQGTAYEGISACLTAFGTEGQTVALNQDGITDNAAMKAWRKAIQGGQCGILLMHKVTSNYWTNGGHYIAIVAYSNSQYLVYDPASDVRTGWHPWGDFAGNISGLYLCNKRWDGDRIAEDCFWGPATTKKAQKVFGTTVDGTISNQNKDMQKFLPNCQEQSWKFVAPSKLQNGSQLIKAIQTKLGIPADGFCGMQTIKTLQKFLGVSVDGYFGGKSVLAFQKWLNSQ